MSKMVLVLSHSINLSLKFSGVVLVITNGGLVLFNLVPENSDSECCTLEEMKDSKVLLVAHFPLKRH